VWESNLLFTDSSSTYGEALGLRWKDVASFQTLIAAYCCLVFSSHFSLRQNHFNEVSARSVCVSPQNSSLSVNCAERGPPTA
jgi:hypothetical protein